MHSQLLPSIFHVCQPELSIVFYFSVLIFILLLSFFTCILPAPTLCHLHHTNTPRALERFFFFSFSCRVFISAAGLILSVCRCCKNPSLSFDIKAVLGWILYLCSNLGAWVCYCARGWQHYISMSLHNAFTNTSILYKQQLLSTTEVVMSLQ